MYEFLTACNAVYMIVIYIFFAYYVGKYIDPLFIKMFGKTYDHLTNLQLVVQVAVQYAITAVIAFPIRKIINKMPFPSIEGYTKINFNHISNDAGIIWSTFILAFEPSLVEKLKILKKNIVHLNIK